MTGDGSLSHFLAILPPGIGYEGVSIPDASDRLAILPLGIG